MRLAGALAVVTGASSGIGAATARALATAGARVVLVARSAATEAVASEIAAAGGQAHAERVDLADEAAVADLGHRVLAAHGPPDLVVNNAGAGRYLAIDETPPGDAAALMASPYLAAFHVTRAFVPSMVGRGSGRIANVTSPAAYFPWPGAAAYSAARWAVRGLTAALRADLRGTGVDATLVVLGLVDSPYFEHNPGSAERVPGITRLLPTLTPETAARAIVRGLARDRRTIFAPRPLGAFVALHAVAPRPVEALVAATGWRRPAGGDEAA